MNNENVYINSLLESSKNMSETEVDSALSKLTESEFNLLVESMDDFDFSFFPGINSYVDDLVKNIQCSDFKSDKVPEQCKNKYKGSAFKQFLSVATELKSGYIETQLKNIKDKHAHVELITKLENLNNRLDFLLKEIKNKDSECVRYANGQADLDDFTSDTDTNSENEHDNTGAK